MAYKTTRLDYKGMKLQTNGDPNRPQVKVFWPSCFLNPLYVTTSLDLAMRWVDAWQRGEQWADAAKLPAMVG
jgi:hypothetical protein